MRFMTKKTFYSLTIVVGLAFADLFVASPSGHASVDPYLDGQMKTVESKIGN